MKKLLNFPSFSPFFQKINKSVFCTFDCVKKRGFNVHVKRCSPLSLWKIFKAKKFKKLSRERENFHGGSAASKNHHHTSIHPDLKKKRASEEVQENFSFVHHRNILKIDFVQGFSASTRSSPEDQPPRKRSKRTSVLEEESSQQNKFSSLLNSHTSSSQTNHQLQQPQQQHQQLIFNEMLEENMNGSSSSSSATSGNYDMNGHRMAQGN